MNPPMSSKITAKGTYRTLKIKTRNNKQTPKYTANAVRLPMKNITLKLKIKKAMRNVLPRKHASTISELIAVASPRNR